MKRRILLLGCVCATYASHALSQGGTTGYPVDVPSDPRSIALGESFVSLPSNPAALMYNPAGLTGLKGVSVSYSRKSLEWLLKDWAFYSVTATVGTSFGVFAAQYNRKSMGTVQVTTVMYPDGNGDEITMYSHNLTVGYAFKLPLGPSLGVAGKYYDFVQSYSGPTFGYASASTTPAYLFDFGLTYTLPPLHDRANLEDSITVGMSYQNIGSRWKQNLNPPALQQTLIYWPYVQLPQYFRIGFSYAMRIPPSGSGGRSPFGALLTGEFRSLQAPLPAYSFYGSYPLSSVPGTSYWGAGLECTFLEILSLRAGASFKPFNDVEGERDRPSFRYGGGIRLPLETVGIQLPLTTSFQYAVVPVSEPSFLGYSPAVEGTFTSFSIEIQYTGSPW